MRLHCHELVINYEPVDKRRMVISKVATIHTCLAFPSLDPREYTERANWFRGPPTPKPATAAGQPS